ncbi:MAG: hypothetical protein EOP92_29555, partial [Lysobacteraceae bacterium]
MSDQSNKPSPQPARAASRHPSATEPRKRPEGEARPPRAQKEGAPDGRATPFRNPLPPITFPEDLPVSGRRAEIAKAIQENQVVIVSGETGSGKTTQLPKICLE